MIVHFSAHISKWELVCKFGVIFHIFIISCLCSQFHAWNQWFCYSIITFSYTKYFVHSYTVDVVFTLSYKTHRITKLKCSSSCLAVVSIHWNQALSREWKCGLSSADRHWSIGPYSSGLPDWHWGNDMLVPLPMTERRRIMVITWIHSTVIIWHQQKKAERTHVHI